MRSGECQQGSAGDLYKKFKPGPCIVCIIRKTHKERKGGGGDQPDVIFSHDLLFLPKKNGIESNGE